MRWIINVLMVFFCTSMFSCARYTMLDGKSRAIHFIADSSLYSRPENERATLYYDDLKFMNGNLTNRVSFDQNHRASSIISAPTFFNAYDPFLVYPGEKIVVEMDGKNDVVFRPVNGNRQRTNELSFFRKYNALDRSPNFVQKDSATIEELMQMEEKLKSEIIIAEKTSLLLFDSLTNALNVGNRFKALTKNYSANNHYSFLAEFYETYRDTLEAQGLFKKRCLNLLNSHLGMETSIDFVYQKTAFNQLANLVLPHKISAIRSEREFLTNLDSIVFCFNGLSRDYLLSQLMNTVLKQRIVISQRDLYRLDSTIVDKNFKKLTSKARKQQEFFSSESEKNNNDGVITVAAKKVFSLQQIFDKHKGNVIVLDFWATWCIPCRTDFPALDSLEKEFSKKNVVFIKISVDRNIQQWRKAVLTQQLKKPNNFLLINSDLSDFQTRHAITTIPRYMILDRKGQLINTDAPSPSGPAFREQVERLLQQ